MKRRRSFGVVLFAMFCGFVPLGAQQDRGLRFTDVDIHASDQGTRGRAEFLPSGYFTAAHQTVRQLIARAYGMRESEVIEVPTALADLRFDIEAVAPDAASAVDGPEMLRGLLVDRFGLRVTDDTRKEPAYALVRDGRKLGRRLREATARCTPLPGKPENPSRQPSNGANECRAGFGWANDSLYIRQSPMATLIRLLDSEVGTVIDRTGLTGKYDADLSSPGVGPGGPKPASRAANDTLFDAVQAQLGLRLEPTTIDLKVVRVTALHRP
jgi:uncharacterized protein (TIGR03435 family)